MPFLEALIQQRISLKEISGNLRQQKQINSLSYKWSLNISIKKIKVFSQNVCKNNLLTNTILEAQREFNIVFIQKLPWSIIYFIPSSSNKERENLVGIPNYPN